MPVFNDEKALKKIILRNQKDLRIELLENGSIFAIMHGDMMINQVLGNPLEGGLGNIYLRCLRGTKVDSAPLMGPQSNSEFSFREDRAAWKGQWSGIEYRVSLQLDKNENIWLWQVNLKNLGNQSKACDVVMAQDLGLAGKGGVRLNEAYCSQYIDHTVLKHKNHGYVLCSRQNQSQGKVFPWIMHGCMQKAAGFLTDGFQFYGLEYKATNVPQVLRGKKMPNQVLQYEYALATLQSGKITLQPKRENQVGFVAYYLNDHPAASGAKDMAKFNQAVKIGKQLLKQPDQIQDYQVLPVIDNRFSTVSVFPTRDLNPAEIKRYFPGAARNVEKVGKKLLSFFYNDHFYVTTRAKELLVERPQGMVYRTGQDQVPSEQVMSTTAFAYGIFNSQVTIANTSFSKLLSMARNHLNVLKTSGQRIFVETKQGWQLLTMPSAVEMGLNHFKWIYQGKDECIIITLWTSMDDPACFLEIKVAGGARRKFLIVNNIVLGNNEWDTPGRFEVDPRTKAVTCIPAATDFLSDRYPETRYQIVSPDHEQLEYVGGDGVLYVDGQERHQPYLCLQTKAVDSFTLAITGNVLSSQKAQQLADQFLKGVPGLAQTLKASQAHWSGLCKNARLSQNTSNLQLDKFNDILYWFMHNAMIHYLVPHGLEQYTGAAWGLRDVCQGPVEFMMCTRNPQMLKEILKIVYSHQLDESGDWPQWFMFDRFQNVQSPDSHGDIIVWPIKAVCDYIELTNDFSILQETVVYTSEKTRFFSEKQDTILKHIRKQIDKMKRDCVAKTALISYGHGDWEDTLQPADPSMREQMVSTWTVELMYQTLTRFQQVCERAGIKDQAAELATLLTAVKRDFNQYLVKNGVAAGLVYFHKNGRAEYMLHPSDKRLGIKYRLLPMTRGMISEMFTAEQAQAHYRIIKENLAFPDGIRLMAKPIPYKGGIETNFKRAETAANFGREIGMQYVHSHIRFLEAMAKLGKAQDLFQGFLTVNPITIDKAVPKALTRQSNAYFSSSDADFADRYQASKQFARIKQGKVAFKGGWRVYSSGPGIYINQLINNCLGLRCYYADLVFDPVLPKKLDGLRFEFDYADKKVTYVFRVRQREFSPNRIKVNGTVIDGERYQSNPYRRGGLLVDKWKFESLLNAGQNVVEIEM